MLRASKAIRPVLRKCVMARYHIEPAPETLRDSIRVYRHFKDYGPMVKYYQDMCPVTKKRLNAVQVLYHDEEREESGYGRFADGNIITERGGGVPDGLSDLEQRLVDTTTVDEFELQILQLTRNEEAITSHEEDMISKKAGVPPNSHVAEKTRDQIARFVDALRSRRRA